MNDDTIAPKTVMPASIQRAPAGVHRMRRWLIGGAAALALLAVLFLAGPRNDFGPDQPSARTQPPQDIHLLDDWLRASEAAFPDLRPGNAKGIVWAAGEKTRRPWAVVYLHGFSASRMETAPLADLVARELGAHLFYARLAGHGRSGPAMGEATAQDWLADTLEALRIGQTLGERVLVISVSTGATLASWAALRPEGQQVAGHVFISPNFGPKDPKAELINGPWGQQIARAIQGETRSWTPGDPREAQGWTTTYPTRALFPMMALVKQVRDSDLGKFRTPLLMFYSEADQTVEPALGKQAFARIGSANKSLLPVDFSKAKGQHVLAGDIKDAQATAPMAAAIVKWSRGLP